MPISATRATEEARATRGATGFPRGHQVAEIGNHAGAASVLEIVSTRWLAGLAEFGNRWHAGCVVPRAAARRGGDEVIEIDRLRSVAGCR
jgi:hypothetical protein